MGSGYPPLGGVAGIDRPLNKKLSLPPGPVFTAQYEIYIRTTVYGSGHVNGANFCMADGSVRFISNSVNNSPEVLGNLATIAGGEVINASDY